MEPLVVDIPPSIIRIPWEDKTYVVSGGNWLEVPKGTTLAQSSQYMVFRGWKITPDASPATWTVEGSKGHQYTVKLLNEGFYTCTCPGYTFRRRCKHIEKIKQSSVAAA